ncbi:MAG: PadR family transcriptional regulator [Caulobacteraceae bacterium]
MLRREHYGLHPAQGPRRAGRGDRRRGALPHASPARQPGLLTSVWREEDKRNKRFYRLSPEGEGLLQRLQQDWRAMNSAIEGILGGEQP